MFPDKSNKFYVGAIVVICFSLSFCKKQNTILVTLSLFEY